MNGRDIGRNERVDETWRNVRSSQIAENHSPDFPPIHRATATSTPRHTPRHSSLLTLLPSVPFSLFPRIHQLVCLTSK